MSAFVERLLADLRAFSGHMLDAGLAPARHASRLGAPGGYAVVLDAVTAFAGRVPALLDELEQGEDLRRSVERRCWTGVRARLSNAPRDWTRVGERMLPRCWVRLEPQAEPDEAALRWLLHLANQLGEELQHLIRRTTRFVEEARLARRGASTWAARDEATLAAHARRLTAAERALERARRETLLRASVGLRPSPIAPSPFPRGRTWWRLRHLARDIEHRELTLVERMVDLLGVHPDAADESTLYQRWCGMRVIEGLEALGWRAEGDYVGALYLAGVARFRKLDARIDLWIESRISREPHASGFICVRGTDATPDFLFATSGAGGVDAFVLDATRSTLDQVLAEKGKYLEVLQGVEPAIVAGVVSGPRRPLRAWSAAPLNLGHCRLSNQSGTCGVVPMHPLEWNPLPLRAWLMDIERHARAWS